MLCLFQKLVDLPLVAVLGFQLPEQKRADWVAAHDRVEELNDLLWFPNELPLDRRQKYCLFIRPMARAIVSDPSS